MQAENHYDVLIIGAGLAGLALARQLLLNTDKRVLLIDRRAEFPPLKQKVGEATVQLSAYYYSKVLDLEEHLLREHYVKYNLRFYWKTPGRANDCYEHYSQSYIRYLSNINTYQLDRNKFEGEILRVNLENPNFEFHTSATDLDVTLAEEGGPHSFSFKAAGREDLAAKYGVTDRAARNANIVSMYADMAEMTRQRTTAELAPVLADFDQPVAKLRFADGAWTGLFRHVLKVFLLDRQNRVRNVYSVGLLNPALVLNDVRTLLLETP